MNISIVIPLFNEEESLSELVAWIAKVMYEKNFTYEIILIDDGSNDGSWREIEKLSEEYGSIRAIKFRRNYGKSAALFCGFKAADGDVVITMDADLQDNPEEIPGLYWMIIKDKYDLVSGWKKKRYDPLFSKNRGPAASAPVGDARGGRGRGGYRSGAENSWRGPRAH